VLNGGLSDWSMIDEVMDDAALDGIMIGRATYQNPWLLHEVDSRLFGQMNACDSRAQAIERCESYMRWLLDKGLNLHVFTRHILGLFNGEPSARRWRQTLSDRSFIAQAKAQDIVSLAREIAQAKYDAQTDSQADE